MLIDLLATAGAALAAESQTIGTKLENATDMLGTRLSNETQDIRTALKEQGSRLDAAQKESSTSLGIRVEQEVAQIKTEISDSAGRQEARSVGIEQAAEKAQAESNARLERKVEESVYDLKAKDSSLEAAMTQEKSEVGNQLRGLGKRIDQGDSATSSLDMKLETMRMEIGQTMVTETGKLEQMIMKADAAAEARDAAQGTRVMQLESDVSGKMRADIAALEGKMTTELSPLAVATERLDRKLEATEELAKRADNTSQMVATKLGLQEMEIASVSSSIKQLDERGGASEEEFTKLERDVEAVNDEVADLSTDVILLQTAMMAAEPL
jgi:chromosome segregation ATPase